MPAPFFTAPGTRTATHRARQRLRLAWGAAGLAAAAVLSLALALALPGCAVGYVARQSASHLRVLAARQDVDRAIAEGAVPPEWLPKIETIREAKAFGLERLDLPVADLYETISLVRPGPTWIVTAAPVDALEPVTWWFPIVGRVAYRGYYDLEDAEAFAGRLRGQDLDVLVRPAGAFSTLGWFADPIRPSMLEGADTDLVNLVLHEASHRVLYLKGQTGFNESFATFVGDEGTRLFYRDLEGPECPTCRHLDDAAADAEDFAALVERTADDLRALYAGPGSRDARRALREPIFDAFRSAVRAHPWRTGRHRGWSTAHLDNAVILSLLRYGGGQEVFRQLLAACGNDLRRAVATLARELDWESLPRGERRRTPPRARLQALLAERSGCLSAPAP